MNSKFSVAILFFISCCYADATVYQCEAFFFSLPVKGSEERFISNIIFKREKVSFITLDVDDLFSEGVHHENPVADSRWYSLAESNGEYYIISLEKQRYDYNGVLHNKGNELDGYLYAYIEKCEDVSFGAGTSYVVVPDSKIVRISLPIREAHKFFKQKDEQIVGRKVHFNITEGDASASKPSPTASPAPTIPKAVPPASAPEADSPSATPTPTPATSTPSPTASTTPPIQPPTPTKPTVQ